MKGFNRLLFFAIICALVYYVGWKDDTQTTIQSITQGINQAITQPPVLVTPSLPPPPEPAFPTSMADRMLPQWPPAIGDGQTAQLADSLTTKNYVLIFDGSGSMAKQGCSGNRSKNEVARDAVIEWAASLPEDANLGLVVFDRNGFSIRLPLGLGNRPQFQAEIRKVVPDKSTPLAVALEMAQSMQNDQGRKQLGYGDYTTVIVTDGAADDIPALENNVNMVLATSPVMIHTIGFCIAADHSLNRTGRTTYRAANNPAELRQGLQEVLAESESFDIDGFK
ncbi:MAG: VWA domain-containing protein [Proteobacteria bacterium]|nr:VWA domain-containing protein [Pseudomonadota bacterium]